MGNKPKLPQRKYLPHKVPSWVSLDSVYFITICTQPKGVNQLCRSEIFFAIKDSILYYQNIRKWCVHYFLLMPDHMHALISFSWSPDINNIISDWKRFTALKSSIVWQRDFFDHRLRKDESYFRKENYISMNPVRAGLVQNPEEWEYSWSYK
ncbi:MAG: hypothetical protein K9L78_05470 [Victivallales bacterium]|nr:hypothetical protein [Victivallales bacterium]